MSRQNVLSTASVRAALERLKTLGALSATDLALLHALAGRLDPDTHRARVADILASSFPEVREDGRENALSKLVLRLNQAQDAVIEQGRLSESFRLGLKIERKNVGPQRELWFTGKAQTQAQPRLHDLDAAQPLYENTTLTPALMGRAAKGAAPILLLTVTERETAALYRQFSPDAPPLLFERDGDPYALLGWLPGDGTDDTGRPHRRPLIAYQCRMGALRSGAAILRTQRAIQHHAPQVVIAVGIAFGDRREQALGDVLVADQVATYESARHNADGSRTQRGERLPASSRWLARVGLQSHSGFAVRKGLMLCGEALLDNADERERLNAEFPTAIGGDMESFGMAVTCHEAKVDWLVIKGVSDWGDGTKSHGDEDSKHAAQQRAAQNAARVAYATIHLAPAPALPDILPVALKIAVEVDGLIVDPDAGSSEAPATPRSHAERVRRAVPRYKEEQVHCGPLYDVYGERLAMGNDALAAGGPTFQRRRQSEADATRIAEASQTIHQTLLDWLRRDDASMLFALLGEYGMGKTVSCQRLSRHLAEARASRDAEPWMRMPVYFDLRNLSLFKGSDRGRAMALPTARAIIDDLFERGWRVPVGAAMPGFEDLREWLAEGALLILDGLDECLVHLEEAQHGDFLRLLLGLVEDAVDAATHNGGAKPRLLISCRTNFFKTLGSQRGYFTGDKRGRRGADDYESRVLLPLTDAQIAGYIASAVPDLPLAAVQALIDDTHDLRELAERPMTLKLLADYIPDLERVRQAGGTVNGAYLYGLIARDWLQRDEGKHHLRPEHKLRLMPALAAHLWRSGVRTLPYAELHAWFHTWRRAQPDLADLYAPTVYLPVKLEEDLRTATFVVRQDLDTGQGDDAAAGTTAEGFRFAHTSMQEYFLAVYLADAVRENRPEDWAMAIPSPETLDFLAQQLELEQAALPAPRRRDGGLPVTLSAWARSSRARASELLLKYVLHARTAKVTVPVLPDLRGADFSATQLRGWRFGERQPRSDAPALDLSRIRWADADLRDCDFAHVRLDDGDFSGARLDLAAFQHCSAQRCDWRNSDLLGTVFRHCRMDGSQWQPLRQCHRPKVVACSGADALTGALLPPLAPVGRTSGPSRSPPAAPISTATLATLPPKRAVHDSQGVVRSVALSADGGRVVSGLSDGTVQVWDVSSGECIREVRLHTQEVNGIALSADGGRVVSSGNDGMVSVWDTSNGECVRDLRGHRGTVGSVALSEDGVRVVWGSANGRVQVWDVFSGESVRELRGHERGLLTVAPSADGVRVVWGSPDGTFRVWDASSAESFRELYGHTDKVNSVALSADGVRMVSGSSDGTVRVWNASSGERVRELRGHTNEVNGVALSANGGRVVSGSSDGTVRVWDVSSGECVRKLLGHTGEVNGVALSADGGRVVSGSDDGTVRVWDASSGECVRELRGHTEEVNGVALSADGGRVVSGSADGTARVWDASSGESLRELRGHEGSVLTVALSADGGRAVSGSDDGTVRVWDASSGECVRELRGHTEEVNGVALSADGGRVVSGSADGTARVWDASSGESLRELRGHEGSVLTVALSADGGRVVSGSDDGTVRVWDASSGESIREWHGQGTVWGVALSADGGRVVSGGDRDIVCVRDVSSGGIVRELRGHKKVVFSVALSADGGRVVSGGSDGTVRVWAVASGECVRKLREHKRAVNGVALSADGGRVVSCSSDGTLRCFAGPDGRSAATAEDLQCVWIAAVGSPHGIPSHASWRPGHFNRLVGGPSGPTVSVIADSLELGAEAPPTNTGADPAMDTGDVLISASGDAWRFLSWDVEDPTEPGGWRRLPLQGYE